MQIARCLVGCCEGEKPWQLVHRRLKRTVLIFMVSLVFVSVVVLNKRINLIIIFLSNETLFFSRVVEEKIMVYVVGHTHARQQKATRTTDTMSIIVRDKQWFPVRT